MKIATLLLSLTSPLAVVTSAKSTHLPTPSFLKKKSHTKNSVLNLPRGGDLGPITSNTIGKTFSILAIGDALSSTLAPIETWKECGIELEPGSKGEHYLGHGLGSSAATLAVTGLVAFSSENVNEAIAYGILTRCAYMTEMLLTGKYTELDVPTTPHVVIYLVLLGTAFGLLSGDSGYDALAKVVSVVLAGHGALLFLNPRIDDDETTKKMAKVDGGYMLISSLFSALLAFGLSPAESMGYSAIFCAPLMLTVLDLCTKDEIFGLGVKAWTFIILSFIGASVYGMLA